MQRMYRYVFKQRTLKVATIALQFPLTTLELQQKLNTRLERT